MQAMDGSGLDRSSLLTVAATISQFNEIEVAILYPVVPGAPAELFLTNINMVKGSTLKRLTAGQGSPAHSGIYRQIQAENLGASGYMDSKPGQHGSSG